MIKWIIGIIISIFGIFGIRIGFLKNKVEKQDTKIQVQEKEIKFKETVEEKAIVKVQKEQEIKEEYEEIKHEEIKDEKVLSGDVANVASDFYTKLQNRKSSRGKTKDKL